MLCLGYKKSQGNHTLFLKHTQGGKWTILVYLDNIIITGYGLSEILLLKKKLSTKFEVKDLGELKYLFEWFSNSFVDL